MILWGESSGEILFHDETQHFLDWYWTRPLVAQGNPPPTLNSLEASLAPHACMLCHPNQFKEWEKSRHAQAMSAGVYGQIVDMPEDEYQNCLNCHAPLEEQADSLATALFDRDTFSGKIGNSLHEKGLICSACHLRDYQWFGPPRRADLPPLKFKTPHNAWKRHKAFEDSRFCVPCHQFPSDGYSINGKLLENTYQEWIVSPQAQKGQTCQFCHMPNRRHLWHGIHDRDSVRSGVDIQTNPVQIVEGIVSAKLSMKNTGVGHYLPSYVTPRIVMLAYQQDKNGKPFEHTLRQVIIERHLSLDLTTEFFDTRLAPEQTAVLNYRVPLELQATSLVLAIKVAPDAFYTRLYQTLLEQGSTDKGTILIQQALAKSIASTFTLYQYVIPLK